MFLSGGSQPAVSQLSRSSLAESVCHYLTAEGDQMPAHWEHEVWSDGHGVLLSVRKTQAAELGDI